MTSCTTDIDRAGPCGPENEACHNWKPDENPIPDEEGLHDDHAEFFCEPPSFIGSLIRADTTLRTTDREISRPVRWILAGSLFLVVAAIGILVSLTVTDPPSTEYLAYGLTISPVAALLAGAGLLRMTRFKHHCRYLGEHGFALFTITGSREANVRETLLRFNDAAGLRTCEVQHYTNGIYQGNTYQFTWHDASGRRLVRLSGRYHRYWHASNKPEYRFAREAELAWSEWLLDQKQAELETRGCVRFDVGDLGWIDLGPGYVEFCLGSQHERVNVEDIAHASLTQGYFQINHRDAKWYSGRGKFGFAYQRMANAKVFLLTLERVAGITVA